MKIKKISKLNLNKKTVANLGREDLEAVRGGALPIAPTWGNDCASDAIQCETFAGWYTCGPCSTYVYSCYTCLTGC